MHKKPIHPKSKRSEANNFHNKLPKLYRFSFYDFNFTLELRSLRNFHINRCAAFGATAKNERRTVCTAIHCKLALQYICHRTANKYFGHSGARCSARVLCMVTKTQIKSRPSDKFPVKVANFLVAALFHGLRQLSGSGHTPPIPPNQLRYIRIKSFTSY